MSQHHANDIRGGGEEPNDDNLSKPHKDSENAIVTLYCKILSFCSFLQPIEWTARQKTFRLIKNTLQQLMVYSREVVTHVNIM